MWFKDQGKIKFCMRKEGKKRRKDKIELEEQDKDTTSKL